MHGLQLHDNLLDVKPTDSGTHSHTHTKQHEWHTVSPFREYDEYETKFNRKNQNPEKTSRVWEKKKQ